MLTPEDELAHDPENSVDQVVRKTPWWSLSLGIHVIAVLAMGFFWVVQAEVRPEVLEVTRPKPTPLPPRMDPPPLSDPTPIETPDESVDAALVKEPVDDKVTQSIDDDPFERVKGDSKDFLADSPFKSPSKNSSIGVGGSAGGDKGGPFGARIPGRTGIGTSAGRSAVREALKWLSRHQNPDGSWNVQGYVRQCKDSCSPNPGHEDFDPGVTGLSLLAFLGAGYSHLSKDTYDGICFGDVVRKGLQWMMRSQDPEGCIGSRTAQKYMYNHTICSLAIVEAYGLTGSNIFKEQAQRSIDFLVQAQNPGKGWRYSYKCGDSDTSVTGWAAMALKSAELSGLTFHRSAYDGTRAWLDEATGVEYGRVGYTFRDSGKVYTPGNEHFDHHEALTAIGVMTRAFMDKNKSDSRLSNGCDLLLRDKPQWDGNAIDFYYWYYANLALFQFDGPAGPKWKSWDSGMESVLVKNQNADASGCRRGSWEPVDRWSGEGGRVYATAINALTLEVYYRYPNVFNPSDKTH